MFHQSEGDVAKWNWICEPFDHSRPSSHILVAKILSKLQEVLEFTALLTGRAKDSPH